MSRALACSVRYASISIPYRRACIPSTRWTNAAPSPTHGSSAENSEPTRHFLRRLASRTGNGKNPSLVFPWGLIPSCLPAPAQPVRPLQRSVIPRARRRTSKTHSQEWAAHPQFSSHAPRALVCVGRTGWLLWTHEFSWPSSFLLELRSGVRLPRIGRLPDEKRVNTRKEGAVSSPSGRLP
jgi:hypothetical protein